MGLFSRLRGRSPAAPGAAADAATDAPPAHIPMRKTRSLLHRTSSASPHVARKPPAPSLARADSVADAQAAGGPSKRHSVPTAGFQRLFSLRRSHRQAPHGVPAQGPAEEPEPALQPSVEEESEPDASPEPVSQDPPKLPSLDMGDTREQYHKSLPALPQRASEEQESPSSPPPGEPTVASLYSQRAVPDLNLREPGLAIVRAETAHKQSELQSFLKQRRHWQPTFSQPGSPADGRASLTTVPASTLNQPATEPRRASDESLGKLFNFDKNSSKAPLDLGFDLDGDKEPPKVSYDTQDDRRKRRVSRHSSPRPGSESRVSTIHVPWRNYRRPSSHASTSKGKDRGSIPSKSVKEPPQEEEEEVSEEHSPPELGRIPHVSLSGSLADFVFLPSAPETSPQPEKSTYIPTVPLQNLLNEPSSLALQPAASPALPRVPSGRRPVPHSVPALPSGIEAISPQTTGGAVAVSLKEEEDAAVKRSSVSMPKGEPKETVPEDQSPAPAEPVPAVSEPIFEEVSHATEVQEQQASPAPASSAHVPTVEPARALAPESSDTAEARVRLQPMTTTVSEPVTVSQPDQSATEIKPETGEVTRTEEDVHPSTASPLQKEEVGTPRPAEPTSQVEPEAPAVPSGKETGPSPSVSAPEPVSVELVVKPTTATAVESARIVETKTSRIIESVESVPVRDAAGKADAPVEVGEPVRVMPAPEAAPVQAEEPTSASQATAAAEIQPSTATTLETKSEPKDELLHKAEPAPEATSEVKVEAKRQVSPERMPAPEPKVVPEPVAPAAVDVQETETVPEPKATLEPKVLTQPEVKPKTQEQVKTTVDQKKDEPKPELKGRTLPSVLARAPAAIREAYLAHQTASEPPRPRPTASGSRVATAASRFQSSGGAWPPVKKSDHRVEGLPSSKVKNTSRSSSASTKPMVTQVLHPSKPVEVTKPTDQKEDLVPGTAVKDVPPSMSAPVVPAERTMPETSGKAAKPAVTKASENVEETIPRPQKPVAATTGQEAQPVEQAACEEPEVREHAAMPSVEAVKESKPSEQASNPEATVSTGDAEVTPAPATAAPTAEKLQEPVGGVDARVESQSHVPPTADAPTPGGPAEAAEPAKKQEAATVGSDSKIALTSDPAPVLPGQAVAKPPKEEELTVKSSTNTQPAEGESRPMAFAQTSHLPAEAGKVVDTRTPMTEQPSAPPHTSLAAQTQADLKPALGAADIELSPDANYQPEAKPQPEPEDTTLPTSGSLALSESFAEKDSKAVDTAPDTTTETIVEVSTYNKANIVPPAAIVPQHTEAKEASLEPHNSRKKLDAEGESALAAPQSGHLAPLPESKPVVPSNPEPEPHTS